MTLAERFEARVERIPEAGCWLWMGPLDKDGYGTVYVPRRSDVRAHRVSYRIFKGEIPAGQLVCHRCDVPSCVNPNHLFLGSQRENLEDQRSKGRQPGGPPFKDFCKYGHPMSGDNIGWRKPSSNRYIAELTRFCRACNNSRRKRRKLLNG